MMKLIVFVDKIEANFINLFPTFSFELATSVMILGLAQG